MNYMEKYEEWLTSDAIDDTTKKELLEIKNDEKEIRDRFFCDIEFGTAGLRGVIGAGTNRINKYIIRKTTQGFADYIKSLGAEAMKKGVVIAHDNRRQSVEFSLETAGVLTANGIKVYTFDSLRTTPELSFTVRELCAQSGVVITASHNPPEYNGYKLYDERGCQYTPDAIKGIIECINKIKDPLSVKAGNICDAGELHVLLSEEMDEKYYSAVESIAFGGVKTDGIKIVYSPQHGTGNIPVRTVLGRLGYNVIAVEEQCFPDTEFSNTPNPNPETNESYLLSYEYARKNDADIIIITDPDCDRLGVAVKRGDEYVRMTGNQSAAVVLDYILKRRKENGTLPKNGVMFNTIVTSDLGDRVCSEYGIEVEKTLTGFKYIGNKIHVHELLGDKTFVFGYEESYGCLVADFVRDKDAVQASLMLCEAAAYYNEKGMSLLDALDKLYEKHGFFLDALDSFMFKGFDGADKMKKLVDDLRNDPPTEAAGNKVVVFEDFMSDAMLAKGFEKTNALRFTLEDGSWVAVRPSGTEPKCKFYFTVVAKDKKEAEEKLLKIKPVFERI